VPTVRLFDDITGHNEVKAEVQSGKPGLEVVSAGQIWINGESVSCVHKSISLGLEFDKETGEMAAATIKLLLKDR
jgi:hypothetical protein